MEHRDASDTLPAKSNSNSSRSGKAAAAAAQQPDVVGADVGQQRGSLAVSKSRGAAAVRPQDSSCVPSGSSSDGQQSSAQQDCPPPVSGAAGATSALRHSSSGNAAPPDQAVDTPRPQRPAFLGVGSAWWAAAACCVVLVAAWVALQLSNTSGVASTHCHPQLATTVVGALVAVTDPNWHQQLLSFRTELSCAALDAADAKVPAVAVACRSDAECMRVAWSFPRSDYCVHVQHFGSSTTGAAGHLQSQLVSLAKQCPHGLVVLRNALTSGLANLHTLIAVLSELGHLTHDGAPVRMNTFVFVLVEQVGAEDLDGTALADEWQAEQQLRHAIRARLLAHYGTRWGSNEAAVLDAMLRRVDVVVGVK